MATSVFSQNIVRDVKNALVSKLLTVRYSYFDEQGSGKIINRFSADINVVQNLVGGTLPGLIAQIITFTVIFFYMLVINYQLLLVSMVVFPLSMAISYFAGNVFSRAQKNLMKAADDYADVVKDVIEGMPIQRSYNLHNVISERVDRSLNKLLKFDLQRSKMNAIFGGINRVIGIMPDMICYFVGAWLAINNRIDAGDLVAFFLLFNRFSGSMQGIPYAMAGARRDFISIKRIDELFTAQSETGGLEVSGINNTDSISFKSVSFEYNPENPILTNLNFSIKNGSKIAIVGSSGGGKTTIFKLICGMYAPSNGEYLLFGRPFSDWNFEAARKNIAVVSQDDFLFPESIEENLLYGNPNACHEQIAEACRHAGIHNFIMSLPQGYNTQVGERGVKLSGGERQRISIARAFLKNAPILILDEPTSALDAASEQIIQESLELLMSNKTVITVAHRLSTIQNANEIFVLDKGQIVERGTHLELMQSGTVYKSLYAKQSEVMA